MNAISALNRGLISHATRSEYGCEQANTTYHTIALATHIASSNDDCDLQNTRLTTALSDSRKPTAQVPWEDPTGRE
jgi:hypothetical protein